MSEMEPLEVEDEECRCVRVDVDIDDPRECPLHGPGSALVKRQRQQEADDEAEYAEKVLGPLCGFTEEVAFPWTGKEEDHAIPEGYIGILYEELHLKKPRFAWSTSPAAMYGAINMLRSIQAGQRHKFIEALVLADDPLAAAKRTLLDAIIDRTVTTTIGGSIKNLIGWAGGKCSEVWFRDLVKFMDAYNLDQMTPVRRSTTPSVNEVTMYSVDYHRGIISLHPYVFSFVPYMHICFFCLPPIETRLYPNGHLQSMRFRDGYVIGLSDPDAPKLPAQTTPGLPSAEVRRVLFAMCGMNKHDGCSGEFIDEESANRTVCSCECHGRT